MASHKDQLHIFFLPYIAPGHMIPMMDIARLFVIHGLESTIVTTPRKKPFFAEIINNQELDIKIKLVTVEFPYEEARRKQPAQKTGESGYSSKTLPDFFKAIALLQHPFEKLLEEYHPNCLVADVQFTWANSAAQKFGIPCLSFHGSSYFSQCIFSNLHIYQPQNKVSSDSELFIVPDLPNEIKLTRLELAPEDKQETSNWLTELVDQVREAERSSYGVIMNSFYELESAYADYYGKTLGIKHWHIGPLSLYFKEGQNRAEEIRGKKFSINLNDCITWLEEKEPNSVIYVCFGSMSHVQDAQLHEITLALKLSGHNFILVVKEEDRKEWMPNGFEESVQGQGLIIRGWAPQQLILNHRAIGGFVTHCGWNSILEGITAGVPMVTWPRHAEQFYSEKLVTVVLNVGVPVGVKRWVSRFGDENEDIVHKEEIMMAMSKVMIGKEAENMRKKTKELKEMAERTIEEGGSSHSRLKDLIEEMKSYKM